MEKSKAKALEFVNNGGKCIYRYGWAYRGTRAEGISKEEALRLLPKYSFGKGFYELDWMTINDEIVLEFNERSENDMW